MPKKQEWFEDWFDTIYYHILYQDRNDVEAKTFMKNLLDFLKLKKGSKLLDLPCGKGRHATFINSLGYDVIGADLSENSIAHAKKFENKTLHFEVHDMREPFKTKFDAIFNLFTSFGYFNDDSTNIKVLKNLKDGLKDQGVLVIDFMNVAYVKKHLIKQESILKGGIKFNIKRQVLNDFIVKDIQFFAHDKAHHYQERVKYLPLGILQAYLTKAGLKLKHTFGEYDLSEFDLKNSSRLIMILE